MAQGSAEQASSSLGSCCAADSEGIKDCYFMKLFGCMLHVYSDSNSRLSCECERVKHVGRKNERKKERIDIFVMLQ